ncbi:hypothetical protein HAX54_049670, partial [Datura stramonium]|nr:hypothetical protein [Datura stramonium]
NLIKNRKSGERGILVVFRPTVAGSSVENGEAGAALGMDGEGWSSWRKWRGERLVRVGGFFGERKERREVCRDVREGNRGKGRWWEAKVFLPELMEVAAVRESEGDPVVRVRDAGSSPEGRK